MTLETPSQHELRTMPETFHGKHRRAAQWVYGTDQRKAKAEHRRMHDERMDNDPEYRKMCIEKEAALREMQKGNYLSK